MKIRTQFIITIILFGLMTAIIAASAIVTSQRVEKAREQEKIANSVSQGASELGYLSNDYLIYREQQQLARWLSRFESFSADVDSLSTDTPEQQVLVSNIESNQARMREVFDGVVAAVGQNPAGQPAAFDPNVLQVAWSRMAVQSQGLISDASLLAAKMRDESDRFGRINSYVIFSMIAAFGAFFLVSYFVIQRRVLSSMAKLQTGTSVIGSGNLDYVIEENTNDEIGELSRAFNRMTSDLKGVTASKIELEQEIAEHKRAREALRRSEYRYKSLFENMVEGFAYHRVVLDEVGKPVDYEFLEINEAFEQLTGLKGQDIIGKRATEVLPGIENDPADWIGRYGRVALDGEPARFEQFAEPLDKWYSVTAYSPETGYFVTVFDDITERKKAEEVLQRLLVSLEQSNADLQQFAYVASHDLKEPLRTVSSYMQLLKRRYADKIDADASDFIDFSVDATHRMEEMIDDLLAYSRVGTHGKEFENVETGEVLSEALDNLGLTISQSQARITAGDLPPVRGDRSQLIILFQNLIANAIKFTGDNCPEIHVSAQRQDRMWRFSVKDTGIGINPRYQERIFIIFQRLHNREEYPGTGIGLAVCKKIVERHSGKIWLESEPGKGSTFFFTLPEAR